MGLYSLQAKIGRKPDEPASEARQTQARAFYEAKSWVDLWKFKKTCKKSWEALGFTAAEIEKIKFYKPDWI